MGNTAALGAFAQGFVNTLQQQRERQVAEEYKKALIEQSKLQTKQLENKLRLAEFDQQMMQRLIDAYTGGQGGALPGGPAPGVPPQGGTPMPPPPGPMAAGPSSFNDIVTQAAQEYGVSPSLIQSVIQAESGGNPQAVSPKGAQGLMQLMPGTAQGLGVTNPFDPRQNIMGGTQYLSEQINRFGDPRLGVAAYNAGPGAVEKYGGIPPYKETQGFVNRVMAGNRVTTDQPLSQAPPPAAVTPDRGRGLVGDILFKKYFDLDPKERERGDVARSATIMTPQGPAVTMFDRSGRPIPGAQYPAPPEYIMQPITGTRGEPGVTAIPKHAPPGFMQTGPGPLELPKPPSEAEQKEFRQIERDLASIRSLREFASDKKNKEAFGFWAAQKHSIYQDPGSYWKAAIRGLGEVTGALKPPSPSASKFLAKLEDFNSAIRRQLYAGNLTEMEAQRYMAQAAAATTPEQFIAVSEALEEKIHLQLEQLREAGTTAPISPMLRPTPKLKSLQNKGAIKADPLGLR